MFSDPPVPSDRLFFAAQQVNSPAFIIDEQALVKNAQILQSVAQRSGAKIVLAQKAFAQPQLYPMLGEFLHGACASGAWEARLARENFPAEAEVITCAPAYSPDDVTELLPLSDHIDFNSLTQWRRYREQCLQFQKEHNPAIRFGIRINPEFSTGEMPLYDPCAPGSRLGTTAEQLEKEWALEGISGLHFHTLCEQGFDDLARTVQAVEERFGWLLSQPQITYLNLGGGHWVTKGEYDREGLISLVQRLRQDYALEIYLEPGEAVAIHSGILVGTVLDLHESGGVNNAILDLSATAHMPDVLEMPYRPEAFRVAGQEQGGEKGAHTYRLTGNTCLAGDQIGDYSYSSALQVGERICFNDMAHYTMVKTTFFNGVKHPTIYLLPATSDKLQVLREFSFQDYVSLKAVDKESG